MAASIPKQRFNPRATLYSPPPSLTAKCRVVQIRYSPGSKRSITSPRLTKSQRHPAFSRTTSVIVSLPPQPPAIYCKHMAVNIIARRRAQENGSSGDIFRLAPPPRRNSVEDLLASYRIVSQRRCVVCCYVTRSNRIHINLSAGPLIRKSFSKLRHATFRRRIRGNQNSALKREQGSDVHDFSARPFRDHSLPGKL